MNTDSVPEILSFTAQPADWQGKLHQSFTLGLGFDLITGLSLPPSAAFDAAMKALEGTGCIDQGLPKKEPEWLLAGKACAPDEETVTKLVVDMRLGTSFRRLLVERETPFTALPLSWENTWGTEQENPQGMPPTQIRRAFVTDAASPFGTPACPGPRGAWPCRMEHMGTYDTNWLLSRWPGVPDDFSWSFYNLSQPCQRLPKGIIGGEAFELTCLHPRERRITGHLPTCTLKLFVKRKGQWREHAIQADTVWFFPNQLTGLLLWHAMAECADESASDIEAVRVDMDQEQTTSLKDDVPKDAEESIAKQDAALAASSMAQSVPSTDAKEAENGGPETAKEAKPASPAKEMPTPPSPDELYPPTDYKAEFSKAFDKNLPEINAGLAEVGLPPLTPAQEAQTRQKLNAMAEAMQAMEAKITTTTEPELADVLRKAGVSESQITNL
ncbi:MAG: DUF2169 domain-containing protein, partial [Desulfovibrio sp.]|nr:DUF2169 domain-containing protein [Desulfovibrio sp.]